MDFIGREEPFLGWHFCYEIILYKVIDLSGDDLEDAVENEDLMTYENYLVTHEEFMN